MAIAENDRRALEALEKARACREDMAAYLDFYAALLRKQFEFKAALTGQPGIHDEKIREQRLKDGVAQLTFEQLGVEAGPLAALVVRLWDAMVSYDPVWAGQREALEPDELLALARQEFETQAPFKAPPPADPTPAQVLIQLALSPYLQRAAEAVLPLLDLDRWRRGYCPVCGGQPYFSALQAEGERSLLCSRCNAEWPFARVQCPFCGNADYNQLAYYPDQDGVYRLYVCQACRRYLKTIDLRQAEGRVLAVEPILTVGMDLSAREQGYH
jgi:formate dehydrogenase maturation protein FdhE